MNGSPTKRRGAAGGGREGSGDSTTVVPLAIAVPANPAGEPIVTIEDSS